MSDSQEDIAEDDTHKLHRLSQAVQKVQEIFVEIRGDYPWEGQFQEVIFTKGFQNGAPANIMEPLQAAYAQVKQLGVYYRGGGLAQSCRWTTAELPREEIDVKIIKQGAGIHIQYGYHGSSALDMANLPSRVRVELAQGWSVVFGTSESPRDGEFTTRLAFITSQWEDLVGYTHPWQIGLEGYPWRLGEEGSIFAKALPAEGTWSDDRVMAEAPLCARELPTFIEATREVEIKAMLKPGIDSNWPLKITTASAIDEFTSLSVTYEIN
jgi:hypothetical protein